MNVLDIEKELGITIPQSPEYDTIGGFVFHKAGTIPTKGWKMHSDYFDLEVLCREGVGRFEPNNTRTAQI